VELIAELDELVMAELERGVEPMPGARSLLGALRELALPLGLVSNSPRRFLERSLEIAGFTGAFHHVLSAHEVARPKPAPDPYLEICARLEVAASDAIALEDSPPGVAAALAAGLTVIGIPSFPGIYLEEAHHRGGSLEDPAVLRLLGLQPSASA
jgi:HAD superfamily hydrolase (TIGR01509 family)